MRRTCRPGFTLIELIVVITNISIVVAILFPVFAAAPERARMSAFPSNLREISAALTLYTQVVLPPGPDAKALLTPSCEAYR